MSKRVAGNYLTDRNWDEEEESEEAGTFTQASEDVIKQRQIRKAKRRGTLEETGSTGGTTKAFSGFAGFTSNSSSKTTTTLPSFNFGTDKPLPGLSNGTFSKSANDNSEASLFSASTANTEKNESSATAKTDAKSAKDQKVKTTSSKYLAQLKILNECVSKWIRDHVEKNPYCILTPIFDDYKKHLESIEKKFPENDNEKEDQESTPAATTSKDVSESVTSGGFSFSAKSSTEESASAKSTGFSFASGKGSVFTGTTFGSATGASSVFGGSSTSTSIFGSSATSAFGGASKTEEGSKPFSFAVSKPSNSTTESSAKGGEDEDEYVPPKPEVSEVKEDDALYTKRCKLFYQKDGSWLEKGVGNIHLKKVEDKPQLLVRADTSLGNILLNIILTKSLPLKRQGKNNVSLICIPNPPLDPKETDPKPASMLIRVKTAEDADELLEKMTELQK